MGLNKGLDQDGGIDPIDLVRKMSELPDGGLEKINIREEFDKKEILKILDTRNQESIGNLNLSDSLYSQLMEGGRFQEALKLCKLIIEREVSKQHSKGLEHGFIIKNGGYDVPTFENISTPTALKWKKRIEEIEDATYSQLMKLGKFQEALDFCKLKIERETAKINFELLKHYKDISNFDLSTSENISTPTALKWKKRIEEINQQLS